MEEKRVLAIDLIKAIAILMVIIFHATIKYSLDIFSILWLEQAVPLFLFTTAFLTFRKLGSQDQMEPKRRRNTWQVIKTLFIPFVVFESIIIAFAIFRGSFSIGALVLGAGLGMGSYYPWLYLQFWLLLPFAYKLLVRVNANIYVAIVISVLPEVAFSLIRELGVSQGILDPIWRVFVGRYVFIMYLAYMLVKRSFSLRRLLMPALLGLIFVIVSRYKLMDFSPIFYSTSSFAWHGVHWPMYFYSCFIFAGLYTNVVSLYSDKYGFLRWIGRNSWLMFLSQMLFFSLFSEEFLSLGSHLLDTMLFAALAVLCSVLLAYLYSRLKGLTGRVFFKMV